MTQFQWTRQSALGEDNPPPLSNFEVEHLPREQVRFGVSRRDVIPWYTRLPRREFIQR